VSETAQLSANADEARIQALREELEKLRQRSLLVEDQEPFDGDLTLPDVSYIDNWCNEVDSVLGDPVLSASGNLQSQLSQANSRIGKFEGDLDSARCRIDDELGDLEKMMADCDSLLAKMRE
ncbi:unnamed protein product, partial [Polarella glacialis]